MFYTLASRMPIVGKSFLRIFMFGSILYILLHYYLFSNQRHDIVEKLKDYLYYIMSIDLIIAYFLNRFNRPKKDDDSDKDKIKSKEEKEQLEKSIELLRLRAQMIDQTKQETENDEKDNDSPFVKKENKKNKNKTDSDKSIKLKTSESPAGSDTNQNLSEIIDLPVYKSD